MAALLDEQTVLDTGFGRLPPPGSQLSEDAIGAAAGFPSLVLPPGPADVPTLHEFHQLQIAFRPVRWLDDSVLADAETAYNRFVDLGGDPTVLQGGTRWGDFVARWGRFSCRAARRRRRWWLGWWSCLWTSGVRCRPSTRTGCT